MHYQKSYMVERLFVVPNLDTQYIHPPTSLMNPVQSPRKIVVKAHLIKHGTLNPRVSLGNSHLGCPGPMVHGGFRVSGF